MKKTMITLMFAAFTVSSVYAQKSNAPGQSCTMTNPTAQAQCCERNPGATGCEKKCDPRLVKFTCPEGQTQDWANCKCVPVSVKP